MTKLYHPYGHFEKGRWIEQPIPDNAIMNRVLRSCRDICSEYKGHITVELVKQDVLWGYDMYSTGHKYIIEVSLWR